MRFRRSSPFSLIQKFRLRTTGIWFNISHRIDTTIVDAVSAALAHTQSARILRHSQGFVVELEQKLACLIEQGTWELGSRVDQGSNNVEIFYAPRFSCLSGASRRRQVTPLDVRKLCTLLNGKQILMVGSETTFHLHSLWLHALHSYENRSHSCHSPDSCSSHHICLPAVFNMIKPPYKPPSWEQDLADTGSAALRYRRSSYLYYSIDPNDAMYESPVIDPFTDIRVHETFWADRANSSNILIMGRQPLPAPAWTFGTREGNWTFIDDILTRAGFKLVGRAPHRFLNAALHITITQFLPSVLQTLRNLPNKDTTLIWHGSWYIQPSCMQSDPVKRIPDLLFDMNDSDPWILYYNSQVYIQNKLLSVLLPQFGVVFLPLTFPITPFDVSQSQTSKSPRSRPKDCLRYQVDSSGAQALLTAFLGGLVEALETMQYDIDI